MIPKIIHYCWFGGKPLSRLAKKCINSWKVHLSDYDIIEWNESNFDVNTIPYTRDAYKAHNYAFVSDYVRFWVLYHYGGLYFDTDVELIKDIHHIIENGSFMGCELQIDNIAVVNPGLGMGTYPHHNLFKEILNLYNDLQYSGIKEMNTVVYYVTQLLTSKGFNGSNFLQIIDGIYIYPSEFFSPMFHNSPTTDNTVSIHHYSGSWLPFPYRAKRKIKRLLCHNF